MKRKKLAVCVMILVVFIVAMAFANDVAVKPNEIEMGNLRIYEDSGDIIIRNTGSDDDIIFKVKDGLYTRDAIEIDASSYVKVTIYHDLDVGDDLDVDGRLDIHDNLDVFGYTDLEDDSIIWGDLEVDEDLYVYGKVNSSGPYDPPYVLYDQQSREEIVDRVKREVSPDKQNGAALFFNKETKHLETYVASEGKFYDLQGNLVHKMEDVVKPSSKYTIVYYLDSASGQIKTCQKKLKNRFVIKEGIELDRKTGLFINEITGEQVPHKEALEWYVESDEAYYDIQGSFLRSEPKRQKPEYITEYRFDHRTGEVKIKRKPVYDKYEIKEGYRFNTKIGQFIEQKTGNVVTKEQAVKFVKAKDLINDPNS